MSEPLLPRAGPGRDPTAGIKAVMAEKSDPIEALQLDNISSMNVWLSIGACAYASISAVLLLINFMQCKKSYYDIFNQGCPAPEAIIVTADTVHRIEFTSAFCFNCVNLLIVAYSSNKAKFQNPGLFKTWAFMNLLFSSTAMILVWANRALFEVPAHQMEYTAEISMTFLETKLLQHGIENLDGISPFKKRLAQGFNMIPSILAVTQMIIFNFGGEFFDVVNWTGDCSFWGYHFQRLVGDESCVNYGSAGGEWYGHCLEYIVGFMNAMQAFFIAVDNKIDADTALQKIMRQFHDKAGSRSNSNASLGTSQPMISGYSNSEPLGAVSETDSKQELEEKNVRIAELEAEVEQLRAWPKK